MKDTFKRCGGTLVGVNCNSPFIALQKKPFVQGIVMNQGRGIY